jgi:GH15 family glucan-1,4-alpha-glucosidase
MSAKLSDYGFIGDCRTSALVSNKGSIDWLCLPDFDSDSIFCKILDQDKGGYFSISPVGNYLSSQIYKENTNILKTDFFNYAGRVLLTDFMPISRETEHNRAIAEFGTKIIRRVKAKIGDHKLRLELRVTPGFAKGKVEARAGKNGVIFSFNNQKLIFQHSSELIVKIDQDRLVAEFELREGEEAFFDLSFYSGSSKVEVPTLNRLKEMYVETRDFWTWWAGLCTYRGHFEKQIVRSALALKLLTFNPTGAVIAAPTTSLPEKLGGGLNWDYRYVWLRDASFTMYALLGLGYLREAVDFMGWLEAVCLADEEDIQIMYGIRGERKLTERRLSHLAGFANSKPVRVGNEAYKQKQLDVYGETLVVISLFVQSGGKLSPEMKSLVKKLVDKCIDRWQEKDASIWEPRDGYQHFTYSKLMCWAGIDRGINLANRLKISAPLDSWEETKKEIEMDILTNGFDPELGAFVQSFESKTLDSSSFTVPILGFLPATDPRVAANFDTTSTHLNRNWFVYRSNDQKDALKQGEGAFFLSTFWAIDNLSAAGRVKEAKIWLEKMVSIATPLGLYAEMYDPILKEHLGNFPQAFTHLGLINSALNLNQAIKYGAEDRLTTQAERLKKVASIFNSKLSETLALIVPSEIRESLSEAERRRTKRHSLFGKIIQKIRS